MGRYEKCTYFDVLYEATEKCFPYVSEQNARTIFREVILAPDDYMVEFNTESYNKAQIMEMLATQLTRSCVEESPQQTHREIVEQAAEIIKHMNDGYITDEDYAERQDFLKTTERYEFALFTAYCLLKSVNFDNQTRLNEMTLNIVRLREIHDLIVTYTRDEQGVTTDRDEFERAKPLYKMLKSLQNLGYDYHFSPKERASLGIDHEDDEDLSDHFNHENWLKRIMLLRLRQETAETSENTETSAPAEYEPSRRSPEEVSEQIARLRGTYNKRGFDKNRFLVLENSKAPLNGNGEDVN
ncbi:MAG: hypothetical protein IJ770_04745 [Alphaproteobacteria bacterium]|nr:hypothetical protein [Alphaproteobacteria bacterium]